MKIRINEQDIAITFEQEKTLGEILGILEAECEKAGSTITGISIDGATIPAELLDEYFDKSPDEVSQVDLVATTAAEIQTMVRQAGKNFSEAAVLLGNIPVQLQTGKDLDALNAINFFSEELQSLHKLLPLLLLAFPGKEPYYVGETPLVPFISEMTPFLQEFLGGLSSKDTVLVGDLAEYELAPRLERLGTYLQHMGNE